MMGQEGCFGWVVRCFPCWVGWCRVVLGGPRPRRTVRAVS